MTVLTIVRHVERRLGSTSRCKMTDTIPTWDEIVRKWAWDNPAVYNALHARSRYGLSDDAMYRMLIAMLLDENTHYKRVLKNYISNHPSWFVNIQV